MSFFKPLVLALGLSAMLPAAHAELRGCAAKKQAIETQLNAARAAGNSHRVHGLEQALAGAAHCDDAQLQREREASVRSAQAKVAQREAELAEKTTKGDPKDIAKAQRKLQEARRDLEKERAELNR
ncbi:DUF1090 domain-containing protein [Bordetella avium]|uniref:DUF1090 domain-containing protein n=1 Tax=Bordetella avium (strain 197N) TaxID=360910 RepID=Q2KWV6_BORA1|nr:DUF1090 domain-containing protein [Bordetella avium]AZY48292.1 DUF1090 domain-containing protein [Bordetella avium]AZY51676.1 DUF1090 domain-containing protein [Bordetella avium]RIQ13463.1 DUF1090 domain-containing protein [Bordetella avium]RIQ16582.1 DUF1090 domain-containing protein [Bordetella avium]RIQ31342.1 DUF1090 domain-containing protein [Bordetella avium]